MMYVMHIYFYISSDLKNNNIFPRDKEKFFSFSWRFLIEHDDKISEQTTFYGQKLNANQVTSMT